MNKFIPILIVLTSCTAMFRGSFLDVEELSFGQASKPEKIIKEIITEDENGAK